MKKIPYSTEHTYRHQSSEQPTPKPKTSLHPNHPPHNVGKPAAKSSLSILYIQRTPVPKNRKISHLIPSGGKKITTGNDLTQGDCWHLSCSWKLHQEQEVK